VRRVSSFSRGEPTSSTDLRVGPLFPGRVLVVAVLSVALAVMATSCTQGSASGAKASRVTRTATPTAAHLQPLGAAGCHPTSPVSMSSTGFRQVEGTAQRGTLWGLLDFAGSPRVAKVVKIVWRMTGSGPFNLTAIGPSGQRLRPTWGPEPHGGSNWQQPGQEWGTGFTFPSPGCWGFTAARAGSRAHMWLRVSP
jgi:hypothetical protein